MRKASASSASAASRSPASSSASAPYPDNDADSDEARTLRPLQAAACTYRVAFGPRAGQKVLTVQGVMPRDDKFQAGSVR